MKVSYFNNFFEDGLSEFHLIGQFLMPALRVPPALLESKISIFANMGCHQHQLKTHFFTAAPAKRKLFSLKQCHFMVFAMLMMQDKIKSRFGNNLARLVNLFRHKVLPRGTEGAIVTELFAIHYQLRFLMASLPFPYAKP